MKKIVFSCLFLLLFVGAFPVYQYLQRVDQEIITRFEGRRWKLPARIYARPLELYLGKELSKQQLDKELSLLQYSSVQEVRKPGEYCSTGHVYTIYCRAVQHLGIEQSPTLIQLTLKQDKISCLQEGKTQKPLSLFQLEPLLFASIYPKDHEDRIVVRLQDIPILLQQTLLLIEDKAFYKHRGVRPLAIVRALFTNLRAGKTVQGGSTLTQQLVKNFFLSNEQTFARKGKEAIMAILLELHYEKDEILEVYCNEIFLGQSGKRAIHGFAMASKFYFGRNIDELSPDQLALLVGLAKGASFYNPRTHSKRAQKRRNVILNEMESAGLLAKEQTLRLKSELLGVSVKADSGISRYPAFVHLVRQQLERDYKEADLQNEGLVVYTTFDPIVQEQAEASMQHILAGLEKEHHLENGLQGAFVLCSVDQGEVLAVVGGRSPRQSGFNRALDMRRPIGSIIKPAVYLEALRHPHLYNLFTTVSDMPLSVSMGRSKWKPENYDKHFHGSVTLYQALIESLNVATVRLGLTLGVDGVAATLTNLGVSEEIPRFPSLFLGSLELPPITILQMYQTIAAGGYRAPLRAIVAVTDRDKHVLQRYPLTVKQVVAPGPVFCLKTALKGVCDTGTGKRIRHLLPSNLGVAGKTGTTNNLRDSWFAGFSGSHVAVAWVGRDDNNPCKLTGSSGAMRVWAHAMAHIQNSTLVLQPPESIDLYFSDFESAKLYGGKCQQGTLVPFVRGGSLPPVIPCLQGEKGEGNGTENRLQKGLQQLLRIVQ